jgi:hypothetical protein
MILEIIGISLIIIGGLLSLAKYRYENGYSKYSPWYQGKKEEPTL